MNRIDLINSITRYLTILKTEVELRNALNLQDINVHAETFFRLLLNLVLELDLKNINIVDKNATAIDLGDEVSRFAIQVTSTSELDKIKHTQRGFVKAGLVAKYDKLVVLIIGERKKYKAEVVGEAGEVQISLTDDVWGVSELLRLISDLPVERMRQCRDFLRDEIRIVEPLAANEVRTLIRVIEVLTNADDVPLVADLREDPDPEGKIRDRFADHADFLEDQYVEHHAIYGVALAQVMHHADLGPVKIKKLQLYLANWSDQVLTECAGDPKLALQRLTSLVIAMMGSSEGFDDGAVRYYLIGQLIACNVFPNKRPARA